MGIKQGFKGQIDLALGTAVLTDYSLADTGDGLTFRTSTSHGYVFDPRASITVKVAGAAVPASDYSVEFLGGLVTFNAAPGAAVTISCTRLKLFTVGQCSQFSFNTARAMLDVSAIGDDFTKRHAGLADSTGTLSRFFEIDEDLDTGGGTFAVWDDVGAPGIITVVSVWVDAAEDKVMRAWALFEQEEVSAEVASMQTAALTWQGTVPEGATKSYFRGETFPDNS